MRIGVVRMAVVMIRSYEGVCKSVGGGLVQDKKTIRDESRYGQRRLFEHPRRSDIFIVLGVARDHSPTNNGVQMRTD